VISSPTDRTSSFRFILNVNFELKGNCVREFSILPGTDDVFVINDSRVVNVDSDGVHGKLIPGSIIYQNCPPSGLGIEVLIVPDNSIRVLGDSSDFTLNIQFFTFNHWNL